VLVVPAVEPLVLVVPAVEPLVLVVPAVEPLVLVVPLVVLGVGVSSSSLQELASTSDEQRAAPARSEIQVRFIKCGKGKR
jgi:hypothetical protein